MRYSFRAYFFLFVFTMTLELFPLSRVDAFSYNLICGPHRIFAAPEIYYLKRIRDGGARQTGILYGARVGYDRINPWGIYWGLDIQYANGRLTGKTGGGNNLVSDLTDIEAEGRLGYTCYFHLCKPIFFTPFGGFGCLNSTNKFLPTSPLPVRFHNTLQYFSLGFSSAIFWTPCWKSGLNFAVKFVIEGKNRVTDDPDFDDVILLMENQTQYTIDIPLTHQFHSCFQGAEASLVPFYRFRHYGGRENFPFDFLDTKFHIYGARIEVAYWF